MRRSCTVILLAAVFEVVVGAADIFPEEPTPPHSMGDPHPVTRAGPLFHPYQERIPRHCWAPPAGISPYQCCPIPKLYPDEILDACGIEKRPEDSLSHGLNEDKPQLKTPSPQDAQCQKGLCLMRHSKLLKEDDSVDYDKVRNYINKWADAHPDFNEAILIARDLCIKEEGPPSPPTICEPDKIFFCLTSQILWNCKLREDTESCQILKEHMEECRPFYMKPPDEDEKGQQ